MGPTALYTMRERGRPTHSPVGHAARLMYFDTLLEDLEAWFQQRARASSPRAEATIDDMLRTGVWPEWSRDDTPALRMWLRIRGLMPPHADHVHPARLGASMFALGVDVERFFMEPHDDGARDGYKGRRDHRKGPEARFGTEEEKRKRRADWQRQLDESFDQATDKQSWRYQKACEHIGLTCSPPLEGPTVELYTKNPKKKNP